MDHPPRVLRHNPMTELLQQAGVDKTSIIRIMGPGSLSLLLWFCRHGYEQVGYVRAGPCSGEPCDLLLVLQPGGPQALEPALRGAPRLRPGGVLIVQTPETVATSRPDPVHGVLARCGYRVQRCLHGRHRELHVARSETEWKTAA